MTIKARDLLDIKLIGLQDQVYQAYDDIYKLSTSEE